MISYIDKWIIAWFVLKKGSYFSRLSQILLALALTQGFGAYSVYFGPLRQQRTPYQRYHHESRRRGAGWAHENNASHISQVWPTKWDYTQLIQWESVDLIITID